MMDYKKSVTLSFDEVVSIEEAAKLGGCSIQSILRAAAQSERLIYVAIRPHSSRLTANASHLNPRQGTQTTKSHTIVAMLPHYAESLAIAGNVDIVQYDAAFKPPHEWHCWELDAPQTISIDSVFVPRREAEAMRIIDAEKQQVYVDAEIPLNPDVAVGVYVGAEAEHQVLSKLDKQQAAILKAIEDKGFNPMAIPDGEKGTINRLCELEHGNNLFKSPSAFDAAWKAGISTLWRMEHHESYAHRGNN